MTAMAEAIEHKYILATWLLCSIINLGIFLFAVVTKVVYIVTVKILQYENDLYQINSPNKGIVIRFFEGLLRRKLHINETFARARTRDRS